jgi:glutamate 5-kinase
MIVIVKIGTSSVTARDGSVNVAAVDKLCGEVSELIGTGHQVVIVSSGAVTAGVAALRPSGGRPADAQTLQALSSIGQHRLMRHYDDALSARGLVCGQVLLVPSDFGDRRQYLHARATLLRLLELSVVPIVNENDAIADDEIRFGDNDRLAALVANLLGASLLVLLTDTAGVYDADPRAKPSASLVEEIKALDAALLAAAGGPGAVGSGGMASKLAAAHMAARSGVPAVIAAAHRPNVLRDALDGVPGVGTLVAASDREWSSRKLWIAFALPALGRVVVDDGARRALVEKEASLLPAGVTRVEGDFDPEDAIEIASLDGEVFAKGIARLSSKNEASWRGRRSAELESGFAKELVHRDDLVILND